MIWTPVLQQNFVIYIIALLWGLSDGIWQTQINGTENLNDGDFLKTARF